MHETLTIKSNQTQLDITIQAYGSMESLFDLLLANDLSLTEDMVTGNEIEIVESEKNQPTITKYFFEKKILPATKSDNESFGINASGFVSFNQITEKDLLSLSYQSHLDIAIQENGTIESLIKIALSNDFSITDYLTPGTKIDGQTSIINESVLRYYKANNIVPATGPFESEKLATTLFEATLFEPELFI